MGRERQIAGQQGEERAVSYLTEVLGYSLLSRNFRTRDGEIDIILMDGQMPKLDGFETTRLIRSMEKENKSQTTPIIAITGYAITGDKDRFLSSGMDDYITKPINENKLIEIIKKYCK